jgi:hypothetical protein
MEFTKKTTGTRDLHIHFNKLVNEQSRGDLLDRIAALNDTDTGLMFYELLGFMRGRMKQNNLGVEANHTRVVLAMEQVEDTTIRYFLEEPVQMIKLTGLLANLNTEICMAYSTTCPDARQRFDRGYPQEMAEIAALVDHALDLPNRIMRNGRKKGSMQKMQLQSASAKLQGLAKTSP